MSKFFSIYDAKAKFYQRPFLAPSTGEAIRAFIDSVNDSRYSMSKHPEDFILFEVGTFDDLSGEVHATMHTSLGKGIDFVKVNTPTISELSQ